MFRKSSLAVAMLMTLTAGNAVALGLGDIELKSALNQPLDAEVQLLSATDAELEELRVALGSSESFETAGIDRPMFLTRLKFDVQRNAQGNPVIHISSRDSVQEPFLDFILEVSWSKGRLVREYTVLVDPPVTMPAPPPVSSAPAVAARTATPAAEPRRFTRTGNFPVVSAGPGEYGPTRRNDTLWKVAQQVRPDNGVSMEQTMLGLLRANPQAFVDNNINNLKAGYVLRVPDREELTSISKADALQEARAQYAAWRAARGMSASGAAPADEAGVTDASAESGTPTDAAPSLQLVSPDMEEGNTVTGGDSAEARVDALQRELMMANEVLEAQRRQDEEMSQRLATLEEQIRNMQRLIQLKDNELARLQAMAGGAAVDEAVVEETPVEEALAATEAPAEEEAPAAATADTAESGADASIDEILAEAGLDTEAVDVSGSVVDDEMAAVTDGTMVDSVDETVVEGETVAVLDETGAGDTGTEMVDGIVETEDTQSVVEETPVEPEVPVAATTPDVPETATTPGFVDRLLQNPLYLGAGALVLALLGFFGIRRKRGVETEFQESILQAAQEDSSIEMAAASETTQPESTEQTGTDSSLLSEFAVSDMGSLRSSGEADPLAEADVYLAYGRYQQAEDLIREALQDDADNDDLNLKLLEVYLAARNQSAFDEHAQDILARLENSEAPLWEKVSEMGRELNPENPIYQVGSAASAVDGEVDEIEELEEGLDFDFSGLDSTEEAANAEPVQPEAKEPEGDAGLDFDIGVPLDAVEEEEPQPAADEHAMDFEKEDFTPESMDVDSRELEDAGLDVAMDSVEPDRVTQDSDVEFDIESFDLGDEEAAESGDGELADLDEVSTKLDLARAYIDMGDPDGARSILDEVMQEGNSEQKDEAQDIMQMIA